MMVPRPKSGKPAALRADAGFTLIELTVALLAGLIVAGGIVALSREATSTFHEEARSSAAEASLRAAVDRLRADLARAGYMSTGNILADPNIAHAPGTSNVATILPAMAGILSLASITLTRGGSNPNGLALSASQIPALTPDLIRIGGNMTSADAFDVSQVSPAVAGGCVRIYLAPQAPAMARVLGVGAAGATELQHIFFPSSGSTNAHQFIVRLLDDTGRSQYLATCPNSAVAGLAPGTNTPYVDVDALSTPLLRASTTGTVGGISGYGAGRAWVNPVQIVQWEITTAGAQDPEPPADVLALGGQSTAAGTDPKKYDLMRSYIDASGNIVPDTSEIIAEYAVDLSFAFSVDNGTSAATPSIQTFAFDDVVDNSAWAPTTLSATAHQGPQRIRSVRARIATRTALADRVVNVLPAPANKGQQEFIYRYCMLPGNGCNNDGSLQWARTRTLTIEVALENQARSYYTP